MKPTILASFLALVLVMSACAQGLEACKPGTPRRVDNSCFEPLHPDEEEKDNEQNDGAVLDDLIDEGPRVLIDTTNETETTEVMPAPSRQIEEIPEVCDTALLTRIDTTGQTTAGPDRNVLLMDVSGACGACPSPVIRMTADWTDHNETGWGEAAADSLRIGAEGGYWLDMEIGSVDRDRQAVRVVARSRGIDVELGETLRLFALADLTEAGYGDNFGLTVDTVECGVDDADGAPLREVIAIQ